MRFTRELIGLGGRFGIYTHQSAWVIRVLQAIDEHVIDQFAMAQAIARARFIQ